MPTNVSSESARDSRIEEEAKRFRELPIHPSTALRLEADRLAHEASLVASTRDPWRRPTREVQ